MALAVGFQSCPHVPGNDRLLLWIQDGSALSALATCAASLVEKMAASSNSAPCNRM